MSDTFQKLDREKAAPGVERADLSGESTQFDETSESLMTNVLIFQQSTSLPPHLRQGLHEIGLQTRTAFTVDQLTLELRRDSQAILILDLGRKFSILDSITKRLAQLNIFQTPIPIPTICILENIGKRKEVFDALFKNWHGFSYPIDSDELVEACKRLRENYQFQQAEERASSTEAPAWPQEEPSDKPSQDVYYQRYISEREQSLSKELGGRLYTRVPSPEALDALSENATDPELQGVCDELLLAFREQERLHLQRVSLLCHLMLKSLELSDQAASNVLTASILQGIAFQEQGRHLLTVPLLSKKDPSLPSKVSRILLKSSEKVAEFGYNEIAQLIKELAEVVKGSGQQKSISKEASILYCAELIDRHCFPNRTYDPRAAYLFLLRLKRGELNHIHPHVLGCAIKILVENVRSRNPFCLSANLILRHKGKSDTEGESAEEKSVEHGQPYIGRNEERTTIEQLTEGMRLTRPVRAFDGRTVLNDDVILDNDLIWRLWQLSIVRPLQKNFVVQKRQAIQSGR